MKTKVNPEVTKKYTFEMVWQAIMQDRENLNKLIEERESEKKEREREQKERELEEKRSQEQLEKERMEREERRKKEKKEYEERRALEEQRYQKQRELAEKRYEKERKKERKELNRALGFLGNNFGELAEHLVAPGIVEKFNSMGFHFNGVSKDFEFKEYGNPNIYAEVDIMLENTDFVIAVEVKAKPNNTDIKDHLKRMEILRRFADRKNDKRKYQGAIAGAIMRDHVRQNIIKSGFYLIEQTGDTMKITIPEGFTPREW